MKAAARLSREEALAQLHRCSVTGDLVEGRRLHSLLQKQLDLRDTLLCNKLMYMYGKCGSAADSRIVFSELTRRNSFTWTIMLGAYAQNGHLEEARSTLDRMPQQDEIAWHTMISAFAHSGHLLQAEQLFNSLPEHNLLSTSVLISAFLKQGQTEQAAGILCSMPCHDPGLCNRVLTAFAKRGQHRKALNLFYSMRIKPDKGTLSNLISIASILGDVLEARRLHRTVEELGFLGELGSGIISLYGKCGSMADARGVFDRLDAAPRLWNAVFTAYADNGHFEEARDFFDRMPERTVVSWNAVLSMYAQLGKAREALKLFLRMDVEGQLPNAITFTAALDACSSVGSLVLGRAIKSAMYECEELQMDELSRVALVKMFSRCGSLVEARVAFDDMPERGIGAWNTMVGAYAHNGHASEAISLFYTMALEGVEPNASTFRSVLSTCSHGGSLNDGRSHYATMVVDHGVAATAEHYVCMVDLLGRSGRLLDAEELVLTMPFQADAQCWRTLLSACKVHKNVALGTRAAKKALSLARDAPSYVLLSNVYTEACKLAKEEHG